MFRKILNFKGYIIGIAIVVGIIAFMLLITKTGSSSINSFIFMFTFFGLFGYGFTKVSHKSIWLSLLWLILFPLFIAGLVSGFLADNNAINIHNDSAQWILMTIAYSICYSLYGLFGNLRATRIALLLITSFSVVFILIGHELIYQLPFETVNNFFNYTKILQIDKMLTVLSSSHTDTSNLLLMSVQDSTRQEMSTILDFLFIPAIASGILGLTFSYIRDFSKKQPSS